MDDHVMTHAIIYFTRKQTQYHQSHYILMHEALATVSAA